MFELPFYENWTLEIKLWHLISLSMNISYCFYRLFSSSLLRSSRLWCLSPVDGTAAKLSGSTATNFTCQLQLPKKKVQMYLFHPGSEGFFSRCVRRPDAVCVTQRENINNQYAHRPVADASKSSKHTAAIPLLESVPIQITLLLPWKHNWSWLWW